MDRLLKWTTWMCLWMGWPWLFTGLLPSPAGAVEEAKNPPAELIDIQAQRQPDLLRLQVTATRPIKVQATALTKPRRLMLDLSPSKLAIKEYPAIPEGLITDFRFSQFNATTVRVMLGMPKSASYRIQPATPDKRVWNVDLIDAAQAAADKAAKAAIVLQRPLPRAVATLDEFKRDKEAASKPLLPAAQTPRVTFDFYNADLHNVFRLLGEVGGVNIIVGEDVKGKATISLKEIPWDQALDMILNSNRLIKVTDGKNIRISSLKDYVETETIRRKESQSVVKEQQELLKTEQELLKAEDALKKVEEGRLPLMTKNIKLNYISAEEMKKIIDEIWGGGEREVPTATNLQLRGEAAARANTGMVKLGQGLVAAIKQTNTLFIRANRNDIDHIERLIAATDLPTPQVMIEARIVEAGSAFARDFGLQWGGAYHAADPTAPLAGSLRGFSSDTTNSAVNIPIGTGSVLAPFGAGMAGLGLTIASANLNIDVRLRAFEAMNKVKIISSPKIMTLDNKKASIKQGKKIPVTTLDQYGAYSTRYEDANLRLEVTPHVARNGKKITMTIKINNDQVDEVGVYSQDNRAIDTQEAELELAINDGETLVIGGVKKRRESEGESGVPGLKEIPLLGWLFKTKDKSADDTELIIFLTPKIIKPLQEKFTPES